MLLFYFIFSSLIPYLANPFIDLHVIYSHIDLHLNLNFFIHTRTCIYTCTYLFIHLLILYFFIYLQLFRISADSSLNVYADDSAEVGKYFICVFFERFKNYSFLNNILHLFKQTCKRIFVNFTSGFYYCTILWINILVRQFYISN